SGCIECPECLSPGLASPVIEEFEPGAIEPEGRCILCKPVEYPRRHSCVQSARIAIPRDDRRGDRVERRGRGRVERARDIFGQSGPRLLPHRPGPQKPTEEGAPAGFHVRNIHSSCGAASTSFWRKIALRKVAAYRANARRPGGQDSSLSLR